MQQQESHTQPEGAGVAATCLLTFGSFLCWRREDCAVDAPRVGLPRCVDVVRVNDAWRKRIDVDEIPFRTDDVTS